MDRGNQSDELQGISGDGVIGDFVLGGDEYDDDEILLAQTDESVTSTPIQTDLQFNLDDDEDEIGLAFNPTQGNGADLLTTIDAILPDDDGEEESAEEFSFELDTEDELIYVTAQTEENNTTISSVNMSLENLERTVIVETSEDEDSDPDGMVSFLQNNGYTIPDEMSYKNIKYLVGREEKMQEESAVLFASSIVQDISRKLELLSCVEATETGQKAFSDRALSVFKTCYLTELSDIPQLDSTIIAQLSKFRTSHRDTSYTIKEMIQGIMESLVDFYQRSSCTAFFDKQDLVNEELLIIIPELERIYTECDEMLIEEEEYRMQVAESLIPHLLKTRDVLAIAAMNNQCGYMKQLIVQNGKPTSICPKCGREIKLNKPLIDLDLFSTPVSVDATLITPIPVLCECETVLLLASTDYEVLTSFYRRSFRDSSKQWLNSSRNFASGSSIIHYRPTFSQYKQVLQQITLTTDESIGAEEIPAVDTEKLIADVDSTTNSVPPTYVNEMEFDVAVKNFYDALLGLPRYTSGETTFSGSSEYFEDDEDELGYVDEEDEDEDEVEYSYSQKRKLTLKEAAMIVTSRCSLNYKEVKNAALFSLISLVKESIPLNRIFCPDNIATYTANALFSEDASKSDRISENTYRRLLPLYAMIASKEQLQDLAENKDEVEKQKEVLSFLRENVSVFKEKAEQDKTSRQHLINQLEKLSSLLTYVKIVNINFVSTYDLLTFVANSQVRKLLDEITDQMIITNYGSTFYDSWIVENLMPKSTLNSAIRKEARAVSMCDSIVEAIKKVTKIQNKQYIASFFEKLAFLSAKRLEPLHAVSSAYRECRYYAFLRAILDLTEVPPACLDVSARAQYINFLRAIRPRAELSLQCSEVEFYLADFTIEEIEECPEVKELKFTRFVPNRLEGETLPEWIARYERLKSENELSSLNSHDYLNEFRDFDVYAVFLTFCTAIFEMEFTSYTESMFIIGFVQFCLEAVSRDTALHLLGANEVSLALMKQQSYQIHCDADFEALLFDYVTALQGFYVTEAEQLIFKRSTSFYNARTYASQDLSDVNKIFDLKEAISSLEAEPDSSFVSSAEDEFDDQSRMLALEEINFYLGAETAKLIN